MKKPIISKEQRQFMRPEDLRMCLALTKLKRALGASSLGAFAKSALNVAADFVEMMRTND